MRILKKLLSISILSILLSCSEDNLSSSKTDDLYVLTPGINKGGFPEGDWQPPGGSTSLVRFRDTTMHLSSFYDLDDTLPYFNLKIVDDSIFGFEYYPSTYEYYLYRFSENSDTLFLCISGFLTPDEAYWRYEEPYVPYYGFTDSSES